MWGVSESVNQQADCTVCGVSESVNNKQTVCTVSECVSNNR